MMAIKHHITPSVMADYRSGKLSHPFAVVVAAHLSICDECRATQEAENMLGGALLEQNDKAHISSDARARLMSALDVPMVQPKPIRGSGIFPAPVMAELQGKPPRWRMLGGGIRQQILSADAEGSLRLLYIPPGKAVPEHGHGGLELTLVLQGSFSDSEGHFGRGDVETAQDEIEHQPIAGEGLPCICLAATDAPLRFQAFLPRLLQPIFRI